MVVYEKAKPYLKRTPTVIDTFDQVQRYDSDNLYPQRVKEILRGSHTLSAVIKTIADFLNGEGFQDPEIANLVVNNKGLSGQTLNDILFAVTPDFALSKTIALHIGYNLNYTISSISVIQSDYCRFGLPDDNGLPTCIKYSTNWERDSRKENKERTIVTYNLFNPSPEQVKKEIIEAGGIENYKGQILYLTPEEGQYPLCSAHPVLDYAQAQAELAAYKVANTQNSFLTTLAVVYPGEFESEEEKATFQELINNKSGARNAGSRIGIQDKTGTKKAGDIFQSLSPTNLDKIYEYTEKSIVDAIMENEAMPKELLGVRPESGMFNQENMEQAYTYFNAITRNRRSYVSRVFATLLKYWWQPISTDAAIIPQRYIQENQTSTSSIDVNDNLKNMTGMQAVNFARILRKYGQGKHSRQEAEVLLRSGFGLTEDEIKKLLDGVDATLEEEKGEPANG